MTPEEILAKSAEDMAEHGHIKGSFYGTTGPGEWETAASCAYGAMARASGLVRNGVIYGDEFSGPAMTMAENRLASTIVRLDPEHPVIKELGRHAMPYDLITKYNDHDTTSAEDVILALKEAAHHG